MKTQRALQAQYHPSADGGFATGHWHQPMTTRSKVAQCLAQGHFNSWARRVKTKHAIFQPEVGHSRSAPWPPHEGKKNPTISLTKMACK